MDPEPRLPETIDHFRIESVVGAGGMGVVYLAEDLLLRRRVALKVMRSDRVADARRRARFLAEARTAASLVHPNVATIYEVGEADGTIFIAMELVPGESLRAVLRAGPVPPERALRWALGIARALAAAHTAGIVHRDLKPDNVMVVGDDDVKLLDFGIAKALSPEPAAADPPVPSRASDAAAPWTLEGAVIGTPQYVSPEQARDEEIAPASDVFSYGVLLYELFTTRSPFARSTVPATLQAVVRDEVPSLAAGGARVSAEVERIVARCLAKAPEDRFASGVELLAAVRDAAEPAERDLAARGRGRRGAIVAVAILGTACAALAVGARMARTGGAARDVESQNADAAAAYREAKRAYREGDLDAMGTALDRAVTIDPSFGSARVSRAWQRLVTGASGARADLQAALGRSGALPGEVHAQAEALEPLLREPPDRGEARRRIAELVRRAPADAELRAMAVYAEILDGDPTTAAAEALHLRELAPGFAPAYAFEGRALDRTGRTDEALAAYDDCTRTVPAALLCREWRADLLAETGDCAAVADEAARIVAASPHASAGYEARFNALVATGADARALDDAARAWIDVAPEGERAVWATRVTDARDLATGDFSDVLARDPGAGERLAAIAFARAESEPSPPATAVPHPPDPNADAWLTRAQAAVTAADARAALEARPNDPMPHDPSHESALGELARLVGRYDEAIPHLRRASRACLWSRDAATIARATLHLGAACASAGDATCACDAYARIAARWPDPKPRSASADTARAGAVALHCK